MNDYCEYTKEIIERFNMTESITVKDYLNDPRGTMSKIPKNSGVYFVILANEEVNDIFINPGTGGYYKGENPNTSIEELRELWVEDSDILYIGKAGGIRKDGSSIKTGLKTRIRTLLNFGDRKNVAHRGGKYLWQYKNSKDFRIYWYPCREDENAVELEKELLSEFENKYGKLPFANLK